MNICIQWEKRDIQLSLAFFVWNENDHIGMGNYYNRFFLEPLIGKQSPKTLSTTVVLDLRSFAKFESVNESKNCYRMRTCKDSLINLIICVIKNAKVIFIYCRFFCTHRSHSVCGLHFQSIPYIYVFLQFRETPKCRTINQKWARVQDKRL